MFQVKLDDYILYDWRLDDIDHEDMTITNAKLSKEKNKTNSFVFNIASTHRYFEHIKKMKSIIKVYQRNKLIFRGRVLEDKQSFNKTKTVDCEGELAFLLDSVYRPFDLRGKTVSLKSFFIDLINNHNSQVQPYQRFIVGDIEVEDPNFKVNFSSESALKTWDIISDKIIKTYSGYLFITYNEEEMPIINYYKKPPYIATQKIECGVNLLDISKLISASNIATACIPYGAMLTDEAGNETGERLTIKSVNNGLDYIIDEDRAKALGVIYANPENVTFDDITSPENLMKKAKEYLSDSVMLSETIELKAVDLANGDDIYNFSFLDNIQILSLPHGLNDIVYVLEKIELNLFNPANTTITLGETKKTLTDNALTNYDKASAAIEKIEKINSDYVVNKDLVNVKSQVLTEVSSIIQDSEFITMEVIEDYVEKSDFEEYKETASGELELTKDSFNVSIKNVVTKTDEKIEVIKDDITELEMDQDGIRTTVSELDGSISEVKQTVDEIKSSISEIADITTSAENNNAEVQLYNINQSEPIRIVIRPIEENISYLYPHNNLYPSDTLYPKVRTLRFYNTTTNEEIDYELPSDLLYYDSENYDEFILDYDGLSCVVNKRVGYNADGTTYILDTPQIINYEYPRILLNDGDYTVKLLGYDKAYLFVRLMVQNIYTTQFATRAELDSEIKQTAESITSTVSAAYETKDNAQTNYSQLKQTATEINIEVGKKVNNEDFNGANITLAINNDTSGAVIKADKINIDGKAARFTTEINETFGAFTSSDIDIIKKIIMKEIVPTTEQLEKYDIDNNGNVDPLDWLYILRAINSGGYLSQNGKFAIDPYSSTTALSIYDTKHNRYTVALGIISSYFHQLNVGNNIKVSGINQLDDTETNISSTGVFTSDDDGIINTHIGTTTFNDEKTCEFSISKYGDGTSAIVHGYICDGEAIIDVGGETGSGWKQTLIKNTGITTPVLTQTSKAEEKKNFEKLDNALDIVKATDIYKYHLKNEKDTSKKHIGFVIGDNYNYSEEITSKNNDGVDIYSMVSVCMKAIQEQQETIESLQKEIKELKGEK